MKIYELWCRKKSEESGSSLPMVCTIVCTVVVLCVNGVCVPTEDYGSEKEIISLSSEPSSEFIAVCTMVAIGSKSGEK